MASAASFAGMIAGLMLLGLAGWIVLTTPASIVENGKQAMQRRLTSAFEQSIETAIENGKNGNGPPPGWDASQIDWAAEGMDDMGCPNQPNGGCCLPVGSASCSVGLAFPAAVDSASWDWEHTQPGSDASGIFPTSGTGTDLVAGPAAPAGSMVGFGAIGVAMQAASASNVLACILWVVFACMLKSRVADEIVAKRGTLKAGPEPQHQDDFNNTIFGCFDDKMVCMQGLCCPLARMAATNEIAGVMGYWQTVGIYFITILCCSSCMVPSCVTVYFRKELKSVMNIRDNTFHDILIACICPSLAICQQGNGVDYAAGFELTGCCEYEWLDGSHSNE